MELEKTKRYNSMDYYNSDPRIKRILDNLVNGSLGVSPSEFADIHKYLLANNDEFFVLKDFAAYLDAQNKIDELYRNQDKWREMSIVNIAHSGAFSSDNTIKKYARDIWRINQ